MELRALEHIDREGGNVICIDKPLDWTSFDVVKKIRHAGRFKKIGHAGTLDPLASGLLILCTERKTKTIESIQAQEKEYTARFFLGASRPSFDRETEIDKESPFESATTMQRLQEVADGFLGFQDQVPPLFSAVMVNGQRAYTLARKGAEVELKPKTIEITAFEVVAWQHPFIDVRIACSKGTYIRSIVRDFALKMGTLGYLENLRRTKIGDYNVENSWTVDQLAAELRNTTTTP